MPVRPDIGMKIKMDVKCFRDIEKLDRGESIDEAQILEILDFIDARYDCADFRMVCVIKTLYQYPRLIGAATLAAMKKTVLGFKYWMDEPGEDGMCYWSENHQLLFAVVEYLAGQLYPGEIFVNNGMRGAARLKKAEARLSRWLTQRFAYGFTEWLSNTYYEEDIAALALLIDFCDDKKLAAQAEIIMDILHLDMALHSFRGRFCATSGRCYEQQKKNPRLACVNDILNHAFGLDPDYAYNFQRISAAYVLRKKYSVPEPIKAIAASRDSMEIRASTGLDLTEIKREFGSVEDIENVGMYLWLMEAFTNVESIGITMKIYKEWRLENNNFLKGLKPFSNIFLRESGLLPLLIRILNPATQGIAIQRANIYTYRTENYMLSTAQNYHPGEFGDQQHIWQATLPGDVTVFSTHPAAPMFATAERNFSPSYWVGNGINPHSAQYRNYGFSIYDLDVRKGYLEKARQYYTHVYFPIKKFDRAVLRGNILCGQAESAYIGVIGTSAFTEVSDDDFKQDGALTGYAVILGDSGQNRDFDDFCRRLSECRLGFEGKKLLFSDGGEHFELAYKGGFLVNGAPLETEYKRYDSSCVRAERKPERIEAGCGKTGLLLDFAELRRKTYER